MQANFNNYLLIINIIGFVLFAINTWLYSHTSDKQVDALLTITAILGGALGIVISIFVFDKKAVKGNMMSRVFVFSILVIQIVIFLIIKGYVADDINFEFWEFLGEHKIFLIYLLVINIITFVIFALDKKRAVEGRSRFRIITLLALSFAGGSVGGILAMYIFRHKTTKDYFTVGEPLIILMQVVVFFYLMNSSIELPI